MKTEVCSVLSAATYLAQKYRERMSVLPWERIVVFVWQQWLRERGTVLRYM